MVVSVHEEEVATAKQIPNSPDKIDFHFHSIEFPRPLFPYFPTPRRQDQSGGYFYACSERLAVDLESSRVKLRTCIILPERHHHS